MKAAEIVKNLNFSLVIGSVNLPIPSVRELEEEVLPGKARIIKEIVNKYNEN